MTVMSTTTGLPESDTRRQVAPWWTGVLSGMLAAASGVALGSGFAALFTGVPTPIESVGNRR